VDRYNALGGGVEPSVQHGALAAQRVLTKTEAVRVADEMNAVRVVQQPRVLFGCGNDANRISVFVFDRPGSEGVNIWLRDTRCQLLSNGLKSVLGSTTTASPVWSKRPTHSFVGDVSPVTHPAYVDLSPAAAGKHQIRAGHPRHSRTVVRVRARECSSLGGGTRGG
jgi:hypothetical protein